MLQFSCLIAVLGVLWLLVLQAPDASAVCCAEAKVVKYKVLNGQCAAIRGQRSDDGNCVIKICGDGRPLRGTYCGRGSCNLAGCDCDGGCLPGDWEKSLSTGVGSASGLGLLLMVLRDCCYCVWSANPADNGWQLRLEQRIPTKRERMEEGEWGKEVQKPLPLVLLQIVLTLIAPEVVNSWTKMVGTGPMRSSRLYSYLHHEHQFT
ncbi:uncharacterized protein Dmoj_GI11819 [Drosophila mojavensis]|uniref:Uncharacterized protein n=1 Tax=Drosophila mojavensis TaxID=7230 RepID=B4KZ86_DROMO|nr:uncharacterized protein Dmoj_GI11819 [Drosophila mojavensis]